jgi:phosphatidylglycerol lysyltransferase
LEALQKFREEGKHRLSLGLSPLSHLEDDFAHNKLTAAVLKFTYRNLNFIYPFQGNASHKKKYDGIKRKTYFSCSRGNNIFELIGILKCLKLW